MSKLSSRLGWVLFYLINFDRVFEVEIFSLKNSKKLKFGSHVHLPTNREGKFETVDQLFAKMMRYVLPL